MPKTTGDAGQCLIRWSVFEDVTLLKKQRESNEKSGTLYPAPKQYDLNGYQGDPTIISKNATRSGKIRVITTTHGLGAEERALFPDDPAMAVEMLKLEYKLGPILGADLNIDQPRESPTGANGVFFGTVKIVPEDRLVPGDRVMVTFSDPTVPAKTYGLGREGTSRNTRRPLIYIRYTERVPTQLLLTHIRAALTNPRNYQMIEKGGKKYARAYINALRNLFTDDMKKIIFGVRELLALNILQPNPAARELFDEDGSALSEDEIVVRMAQWLHATPMDRKRKDKLDASTNGSRVWGQLRLNMLNRIYFFGNKAYEFNFRKVGNTAHSDARDLKTGKIRGTAEGDVLRLQINSAAKAFTSVFMAQEETNRWRVGTVMVGGEKHGTAILLVSRI